MTTRVVLEWRNVGRAVFYRIGSYDRGTLKPQLPKRIVFWLSARFDVDGVLGPRRQTLVDPKLLKVEDRVDLATATLPVTKVTYKDGVLEATQAAPEGGDASEYKAEIRVGEDSNREDQALAVGAVKPCETLIVNALPVTKQVVHTRIQQIADGECGPWNTVDVITPAIPSGHVSVEDFAGSDIEATGTIETEHGFTPLENGSGVIQTAEVPSMFNTTNTDSIFGMVLDETRMWALGKYFPKGRYVSAAFDGAVVHEALPVFWPEFNAKTYEAQPSIFSGQGHNLNRRDLDVPGGDYPEGAYEYADRETGLCIFNVDQEGDRQGLEIEKEIAVTQDGTPPVASGLERVVEGRRYWFRQIMYGITFRSRFGRTQIKLTKCPCRRLIKNRKHEIRQALALDGSGDQTYTFPSEWGAFLTTPVVQVQIEDTSPPANKTYLVQIVASSATAVTFRVFEDDGGTVPAVTDQNALIQVMGY